MIRRRSLAGLIAAAFALLATGEARAVNPEAVLAQTPPRFLSAYGLFEDAKAQVPSPGVVPYRLNTPLFTDYAAKLRFVYMPSGSSAAYRKNEVFAFPVGTVLVKTFAYPADFRKPGEAIRLIETRLMIHKPDGWIALPYVWNAEMTEAVLKKAGARVKVETVHLSGRPLLIDYRVPNVNQCKGCHFKHDEMTPIGPKARNLNGPMSYGERLENQLSHWAARGYLTGAPENPGDAPAVPVWNDPDTGSLHKRARAYLDVNCAHCHTRGGPGDSSGLFLDYTETETVKIGLNKRPVAAGRGSGGRLFDIRPGDPDGSIFVYRMESADPGIMMPELGRTLVHEEGVQLIRDWIAAMEEGRAGP